MLSSLLAVFLLWATGTILLILYTVDDEQSPRKKKVTAADLAPGPGSGLGGELSRLEANYDGSELELHRADYLASHKHTTRTIRDANGVLRWKRRDEE